MVKDIPTSINRTLHTMTLSLLQVDLSFTMGIFFAVAIGQLVDPFGFM
jgi:hypothetical protein